MWLFGQANKEEIKKIKKMGWDVFDKVDVKHFNKSLDPEFNAEEDPDSGDPYKKHESKLIAVFIDNDIIEPLTKWHNEDKAIKECHEEYVLDTKRREVADAKFEQATREELEIPEDQEIVDHEGWESNGDDSLIKKFYYSNPDGGDSIVGCFIVDFRKNDHRIIDFHSNT